MRSADTIQNLAYNLARSGYKWHKYPPGYEPPTGKMTNLGIDGGQRGPLKS